MVPSHPRLLCKRRATQNKTCRREGMNGAGRSTPTVSVHQPRELLPEKRAFQQQWQSGCIFWHCMTISDLLSTVPRRAPTGIRSASLWPTLVMPGHLHPPPPSIGSLAWSSRPPPSPDPPYHGARVWDPALHLSPMMAHMTHTQHNQRPPESAPSLQSLAGDRGVRERHAALSCQRLRS